MNPITRLSDPSTQFDKLPPHNIQAEQCLIASMMLDRELIEQVNDVLPGPEVFYLPDHQFIYKIIIELYQKNRPVDAVILREQLSKRGLLDEIGGTAYLAEMLNTVPSAANGPAYCRTVFEKFQLREIITAASEAIRSAYAPYGDDDHVEQILSRSSRALECIRSTGGIDPTVSLHEAAVESLTEMRGERPRRLLVGLNEGDETLMSGTAQKSFDKISGGLPFRQFTVIGGRPGSGKSAFAKSILLRLAKCGWQVGVVTLEEDRIKIADNGMAHESGVANWKVTRGTVSTDEYHTLAKAAEGLKDVPFFIDDTCRRLSDVARSVRRLVKKYGCQVVAVDHLHLVQVDGEDAKACKTRNDEIRVISGTLKALAKTLDIVMVGVCQLNRGGGSGDEEDRIDRLPELTNLREGGALEQDGDLVILLHRPDYYRTDPTTFDRLLQIKIAKNKVGGMGVAMAYWDGDHQSVGNWNDGHGPHYDAEAEALNLL